jgi:outer membrane protein OmpA-like peptidoglycan-associated protein
MQLKISALIAASVVPAALTFAQTQPQPDRNVPLFRVTVVQRTVKAINYQYRSGPTNIDFRGTVLLPKAKGEATVESKQGRTEISVRFDGLKSPQRFGREYLTYVLWAITPDGRPRTIAEVVPGHSDKATLNVTTDLQAFALIVTAEPYSAVRQPSDVVVLENEVRPDTAGSIQEVNAKYDLLRRGDTTFESTTDASAPNAPSVSMHEYEALTQLYEAQNAVNSAAAEQAEKYAPEVFSRAQTMLQNAQQLHASKADYRRVVQSAREASQTAEDARIVAERRKQEEELKIKAADLAAAQARIAEAEKARQTEAERAQAAVAVAQTEEAKAEVARQARDNAEQGRAHVEAQPSNARVIIEEMQPDAARQRKERMALLSSLKPVLPTLDTARGIVVTVPDQAFRGGTLRDEYSKPVIQVAAILVTHPGLHVEVQAYSDTGSEQRVCQERGDGIRHIFTMTGLPPASVSAQALGDSRPVTSNATPQGRIQNRRVEIVITGTPIGRLPLWEPATGGR